MQSGPYHKWCCLKNLLQKKVRKLLMTQTWDYAAICAHQHISLISEMENFSNWVKISILNMIFQMRWKNNQDMLIGNCSWWIQNQLSHFVSHILGRWEYHWKDLPITSYPRVDWNSIEVLCRVLTYSNQLIQNDFFTWEREHFL